LEDIFLLQGNVDSVPDKRIQVLRLTELGKEMYRKISWHIDQLLSNFCEISRYTKAVAK
jgi:hypothetical protein